MSDEKLIWQTRNEMPYPTNPLLHENYKIAWNLFMTQKQQPPTMGVETF